MNLLTASDIARMLAVKPKTVYAWASQEKIPHFKIGGVLRFSREEVAAWVQRHHKRPDEVYNTPAGGRPREGG